jgi:hypothetical protein
MFKIKILICFVLIVILYFFWIWINEDDYHPNIPNLSQVRIVLVVQGSNPRKYWCINNKGVIDQVLVFLKKQSKEKWTQWPANKPLFDSYPYTARLVGPEFFISYGNGSLFTSGSESPKDNMYRSISMQDEERLLELTGVKGDKRYKLINPDFDIVFSCS